MKCTPHNLEALLFFFFSKKGSNLNKFEKMKSIFIFSRKKRARRRKEKKRSGGRKRRKEETTRRLQERGSGDIVCQTFPKLSLSRSLALPSHWKRRRNTGKDRILEQCKVWWTTSRALRYSSTWRKAWPGRSSTRNGFQEQAALLQSVPMQEVGWDPSSEGSK